MKILSLQTLSEFDGGSVGLMVNQALARAYRDMDDRPNLAKPRKVTIELQVKPEVDPEGGGLANAVVVVAVKESLPQKESRVNVVRPVPSEQGLGFEPDSRGASWAPGQTSLGFEDEGGDE